MIDVFFVRCLESLLLKKMMDVLGYNYECYVLHIE